MVYKKLFLLPFSVRCYGSCAVNLCHVAAGRGDFYVEYGVHIWDYVAGALIAQEAGATVRDPEGIVASIQLYMIL